MKERFVLVFFLSLFLLEGLGILSVYKNAPYIYILLPGIIFILFGKKQEIKWPILATAANVIFIGLSLVSSIFFAVNKQVAFEKSIFYLSSFLIFIYFYNQKKIAHKYIDKLLILVTPIFLIVFLLMTFLFKKWIGNFYITEIPYNLVVPIFTGHNHLGDFLGLVLIFLLMSKRIGAWQKTIIFIPVFTIFLLSFSRSAYLAFVFVLLIIFFTSNQKTNLKQSKKILVLSFSLLILFFGFILLPNASKFFPNTINRGLLQRYKYWVQAGKSILKKPFFGAGAGNFETISNLYRKKSDEWTDSAHSLSVEILSGQGIMAFAAFTFFLSLIYISAKKNTSLYPFLFLYLFINLQTDYIYQISSVYILLMILAASFYTEKRNIEGNKIYGFFSVILIWLIILIASSAFFLMTEQPRLSLFFYPFNKLAFQKLIINDQKQKNYEAAKKDAIKYEKLFFEDIETNIFLAGLYADWGNEKRAKALYEKVYKLNKFINFDTISRIYRQKVKVGLDKNYDNLVHYQIAINYPIKYFYEPLPKTDIYELNKYLLTTTYSINNDSLNDRFDYPEKKEDKVFRIITIGDSFTYGRYINTAENWAEILEDRLSKNNNCLNIDKFEVINLGVNGYDPQYTSIRYKKRGVKYNPDLIIWPVSQYYFERINEETRPIAKELQPTAEDFSSKIWEKAKKQVDTKWGKENIINYQKKYIGELASNYKKNFLIIEIDGEKGTTNKILKDLEKNNKVDVFTNNLTKENYFPGTQLLNRPGSKQFAEKLAEFIVDKDVIRCEH